MTSLLIICGLLVTAAAIVSIFMAWRWNPIAAYAGMILVYAGAPGIGTPKLLIFWGVASALALAVNMMLPKTVASSRTGVPYMTTGALTGMLLGLLTGPEWMVAGAAIGAALGAVAFARTPAGRTLGFPSRRFFNYLCAKAIPAVVTLSIAGYSIIIAAESYAG